ncbi:MAG TPA: adenine phosphoribosyltransferase [Chitinophagales bacterium]|nr:adenine phosphoribosyltransferase [Chitinophagales bacterium]
MINTMSLREKLNTTIRTVPDFPKPGIQFKDITPIFLDPRLCDEIAEGIINSFLHNHGKVDAICAIESRGFFIGILIAQKLNIPLFPVRKKGKLPAATKVYTYDLEYGTATLEIHTGVVKPEWHVMIHDDLLATGGTAMAAAELVKMEGGHVSGFSFIAELDFLNGRDKITPYSSNIVSSIHF